MAIAVTVDKVMVRLGNPYTLGIAARSVCQRAYL
jgi:hypothetical protein